MHDTVVQPAVRVKRPRAPYPWPGSVRGLRNALKRAAVLADGPITLQDLPGEFRGGPSAAVAAPAGGGPTTLKDVVRYMVKTAERDRGEESRRRAPRSEDRAGRSGAGRDVLRDDGVSGKASVFFANDVMLAEDH